MVDLMVDLMVECWAAKMEEMKVAQTVLLMAEWREHCLVVLSVVKWAGMMELQLVVLMAEMRADWMAGD